jgi:hypothetical protein
MRICIVCKESKDESCFYRRKSNGYYTSECKPCATAKVKARQ